MQRMIQSLLVLALLIAPAGAQSTLEVTVTNNAPGGGTYLTPVWFGFHNGSFDSYDGGTASSFELERLAEDGNSSFLADTFANGGSLIGGGMQNGADRVQGSLGAAPIGPGQSASSVVTVSGNGSNQFFSYASMILPSNDYYIANGNPEAFDVSDIIENGGELSFNIFQVNDAGTEVNDFATSAGNGFFGDLLPGGQNGPDQGADENGVNRNVLAAYAGFLNAPADGDVDPAFAALKFTDQGFYPNGVATITIRSVSTIPEPNCIFALSALGLGLFRRSRRS